MSYRPYLTLARDEWAALRAATPLTLSEDDLAQLRGLNEAVSLDEVTEIYLPLSRLLNLHVAARQELYRATDQFLGRLAARVPYVIAIAGSVAVGKSTTARILQALLSRWPDHPRVDLVTTDSFLHPNRTLEERGLMQRKGFPESYDQRALVEFVAAVKSGAPEARAPVYSHFHYDIVPGESIVVRQPDILILEGLNVLQTGDLHGDRPARVFVSDFFDLSVYVDAAEEHLESWFIARLLELRATAFQDPASYFHTYASVPEEAVIAFAKQVWSEINLRNLRENIAPTRERSELILEKAADHSVRCVRLRLL